MNIYMQTQFKHCSWHIKQTVNSVPTTFHPAAICPNKDNHVTGRLFNRACKRRIPPWKHITMYLEARYPPPLVPPVLSRIITWSNCASEKSTLVVTAHCTHKKCLTLWINSKRQLNEKLLPVYNDAFELPNKISRKGMKPVGQKFGDPIGGTWWLQSMGGKKTNNHGLPH